MEPPRIPAFFLRPDLKPEREISDPPSHHTPRMRQKALYILWEQILAPLEASPQPKIGNPKEQLQAVTLPRAILILDSAPRGQD